MPPLSSSASPAPAAAARGDMPRREITTPEELPEEGSVELSLRPQRLAEFIGQSKVKDVAPHLHRCCHRPP